jgi:thioredoxin-dependent peroxiredoxin
MLKIGQKAPDFKLKTYRGGELSLKELAGRRVVIFFFPKANTPG